MSIISSSVIYPVFDGYNYFEDGVSHGFDENHSIQLES